MRIVCAPDSFKESIDSVNGARALALGIRDAGAVAEICPVADGGEGTLMVLTAESPGALRHASVMGPLGKPVRASYGAIEDRTGLIEFAQAAGIGLVPLSERHPGRTTSYGVGELLQHARQTGFTDLVLTVGGSATCDGGAGLVQALGGRFLDDDGAAIATPIRGDDLIRVRSVVPPPALGARLRIACDVTNPLLGAQGSAAIYGPQKGATPKEVRALERGLAQLVACAGGDPDAVGAGASGGAAYGAATFLGAELLRGADLVLELVAFDRRVAGADLVLTGEGRLDAQSADGKACTTVARRAAALGVETIALVGVLGDGWERCVRPHGPIASVVSLTDRFGARALSDPGGTLREAARAIVQAQTA